VASHIFWIFATLNVVISVMLMVRVRTAIAGTLKAEHVALARGQQKDSWLTCAAVWIVLLSEGCPVRDGLFIAATPVVAWLLHRAVRRYRLLH
jgi:hypothetical protein